MALTVAVAVAEAVVVVALAVDAAVDVVVVLALGPFLVPSRFIIYLSMLATFCFSGFALQ